MSWELEIEHIGGIEAGAATIEPAINVVRGANWQGKSSFLKSIETIVGTETPLMEGKDRGHVRLDTGADSYEVSLERRDGDVVRDGTPLLTDPAAVVSADLYAFLGEDNEVRAAVRRGQNLEAVLTRPLDFENIEEEIADLKSERDSVEAERDRAREAAKKLASVEATVTDLEAQREDLRERRAELRETATDGSEALEALRQERTERDELASRAERLADAVDRIESRLEDRRAEYEQLDVPEDDVADELATVREGHDDLERNLELLRAVYSANKRVLDEGRVDLLTDVDRGLIEDTVACWTCGSEATEDDLAAAVEELGERVSDLRAELSAQADRIADLEERRATIRERRRRRGDLEAEIADLEATLADRRESLADVRDQLQSLEERIEDRSADVAAADEELTEVESELTYVERELADKREQREQLAAEADRRDTLAEEYDRLTEEIEALRNRKTEMRRKAREAFQSSVQELLERFDTSFETARITPNFELVVARDGREASLTALSEGELELLGIVCALAGHEAYETDADVPVLALDALGPISGGNLRTLIDYVADRATYIVFTAFPEHGDLEGHEIQPRRWSVVSDPTPRDADA